VKRVTEDFSPFEILVTTNEGTYELCDPVFRMRVILTESWEWFGQWGGTSLMGSFTWGNNTPCFVFSLLLNYQAKKIAEAASHEAGHTLGLYHQSLYSPGCVLLSEYYSGIGSGELGWAPIMGVGYYRNMTTWWKGKTNIGCNNIQDDLNIINNVLDIRVDDHNKLFPHATPIGLNGIDARLNSDSDEDKFFVDLPSGKILTVAPFNIGNNIGGNIDILVRIYSANKTLLATINDPNSLSIATTLNAGKYYISVESVENANTSRYGQLGNYSVRFN
jgi:hypothetical protein